MDSATFVSPVTFNEMNNIQQLPLEGLVAIVMSERSALLENKVRDHLEAVESNNNQLEELNGVMATLRNDMSQMGTEADDEGTMSPEVEAYLQANFPDFEMSGDHKYTRATMELQLENMKGKADSLSSVSQLDMVELQSVMGKYEQSIEWMSNLVSKIQGTSGSVIRNMA